MSATFVYDADGNRVQSSINGTTTTPPPYPAGTPRVQAFVGNHYEVTGSTVTKYYYAGGSRVATLAPGASAGVRQGSTLSYLLADQLGSTSITTDTSGNKVSELRYSACPLRPLRGLRGACAPLGSGSLREGSQRYSWNTTATKYTYTGQYSNMGDFGLMFYVARWYDPALGRFAQADSIVPDAVQGYDRYAYVNNAPVISTDPTGHYLCEFTDVCTPGNPGGSGAGNSNEEGGSTGGTTTYSPPACGIGGISNCPPYVPPIQACIPNNPCLNPNPPMISHPTDFLVPNPVQTIYVYSPQGEIIGYYVISYAPGEFQGWNWDANNSFTAWSGLGAQGVIWIINSVGSGICSACGPTFGGLTILNLIDQSLEYDTQIYYSPIIPVLDEEMPRMDFPFSPQQVIAWINQLGIALRVREACGWQFVRCCPVSTVPPCWGLYCSS